MKTSLLLSSVLSVFAAASASGAVVVAGWTFETSVPTTAGPHAAEVGTGQALGFHTSDATVYSNPVGNGSSESFSSNTWSVNDYYQFSVNTSGFSSPTEFVQISWEQTRSSTGPESWQLAYSTDGTTFTSAMSYTVDQVNWSASTFKPGSSQSWDASSVSGGLLGQDTLIFRLISLQTTAAAGTSRVDDVYITVVPEPHEYAAMAGLGLLGFAVWRRTRRA